MRKIIVKEIEFDLNKFRKDIKKDLQREFTSHHKLLRREQFWQGQNVLLCNLKIIDIEQYKENIDLIYKYYNLYIEKKNGKSDL